MTATVTSSRSHAGKGSAGNFIKQYKRGEIAMLEIVSKVSHRYKKRTILWDVMFQLRTAALKAYCAILVRRSNFRHQASPRLSPRESTQRRKVEMWARNVREFCLNFDFHVTFRDLLHAVKLRHGTDGFTSPPKEGALRIFSP